MSILGSVEDMDSQKVAGRRCAEHGKLTYPTEKSARMALAKIRNGPVLAGEHLPVRWYGPDTCGAYHLTSKPAPVCVHCGRDPHPGACA